MFVVTVTFELKPEYTKAFVSRVKQQAKDSLSFEPECHIFDVCLNPDQPDVVFLYEVYTNQAAFDSHLESSHFKSFDIECRDWVLDKQVKTYLRTET